MIAQMPYAGFHDGIGFRARKKRGIVVAAHFGMGIHRRESRQIARLPGPDCHAWRFQPHMFFLRRDPADDFRDPTVPPDSPLSPHVLYKTDNPGG
jgi:hypothetical protein